MGVIEAIMETLTWAAWISWVISIAAYVYLAFCLQTIANKTNTEHGWLAWIPIANVYLMCKIAEKPWWWLLLCLIPIVNIVIMVILWMGIAQARDKKGWLGILMIIPIANFVVLGYLAFSGGATRVSEAEVRVNLMVPGHLAYAGEAAVVGGVATQPGKVREVGIQAKKEAQEAIPDIGSEVYRESVQLVIPLLASFQQVAQFEEYLGKVKDLAIVMTGGSVDEGLIIAVSGREQTDLIPILNEMPVVEDASKKGENVVVKLKTPNASEEGGLA